MLLNDFFWGNLKSAYVEALSPSFPLFLRSPQRCLGLSPLRPVHRSLHRPGWAKAADGAGAWLRKGGDLDLHTWSQRCQADRGREGSQGVGKGTVFGGRWVGGKKMVNIKHEEALSIMKEKMGKTC